MILLPWGANFGRLAFAGEPLPRLLVDGSEEVLLPAGSNEAAVRKLGKLEPADVDVEAS